MNISSLLLCLWHAFLLLPSNKPRALRVVKSIIVDRIVGGVKQFESHQQTNLASEWLKVERAGLKIDWGNHGDRQWGRKIEWETWHVMSIKEENWMMLELRVVKECKGVRMICMSTSGKKWIEVVRTIHKPKCVIL